MRDKIKNGYHFCCVPKCETQINDGCDSGIDWTKICPAHQEVACEICGGRGMIVFSHNEGDNPALKEKTCKACKGTGVQGAELGEDGK